MSTKGKLAIYWAASCGGCEIAILAINERLLELIEHMDLVFCPCLMDTKVADVEAMPDGAIDVCLFNGAIRTSEQEAMAQLMRAKSKILIAFGSCAVEGSIPGLANATTREAIFRAAYDDSPSTDNPEGVHPQTEVRVNGHTLHLPAFYETVRTLAECVPVDYFLPGCPPEADRIWEAVQVLLSGELPPRGATLGRHTTVCDDCPRVRDEKRIPRFYRTWEIIPDPERCLLDQGLICCGVATRAGCGALCPRVNSPCIGCYGPNDGVDDFGARLMSALASVLDVKDPDELGRVLAESIPDPLGTFYRFTLPHSLLRGAADAGLREASQAPAAGETPAEQGAA